MTQNELLNQLRSDTAAIVTTLFEIGEYAPAESTIYLALGMDMGRYERVRGLMVASDLIHVSSNRITLLEKGRRLGEDLNKILAESK